ncbi:hypothetical protein GW916_03770 [bacterium]|nr:hypothetical protein [bacterium]
MIAFFKRALLGGLFCFFVGCDIQINIDNPEIGLGDGTVEVPTVPDVDTGDEAENDDDGEDSNVGRLSGFEFAEVETQNFDFEVAASMPKLSPSCLRRSGLELIILDPGHDDSDNSRRSDAKDPGGSKYYFKWPKVHEGQMAQVTAYFAYEYLVSHPGLSDNQRNELKTMIRFTRHPGESKFGQYESERGYGVQGGTITSGVTNRRDRINHMITNHRPYESSTGTWSRSRTWDLKDKTIFLSIHGNSTTYFEEGDHTWLIPAKNDSGLSGVQALIRGLKKGWETMFGDFLETDSGDSAEVVRLKNGSQSSVREESIRSAEHSTDLAVLSSNVKTDHKLLLEGFVMNGKIGKLAHLDMSQGASSKKLVFKRNNTIVKSYDVAGVYLAYARSIAAGLVSRLNCE